MAIQLMYILNRNYDSSDQTTSNFSTIMTSDVPEPQSAEDFYTVQLTPSIESLEWSNKPGHTFKEWNTKRDGSGDSYSVGVHLQMAGDYDNQHNLFAIWQLMNLSKIKLNGITYNLKDAEARQLVSDLEDSIPEVPSVLSELVNDVGYITSYTETDPIFTASAAAGISSTDISNWNAKSDFSGSYNDLTNKPTIPNVTSTYDATSTDAMNGVAISGALSSCVPEAVTNEEVITMMAALGYAVPVTDENDDPLTNNDSQILG